jgi:glycosyltransferase involved in cell wall biosynthesis
MRTIHQIVGTLAPYDAISNEVLQLQEALRGFGYESNVFAEARIGKARDSAQPLEKLPLGSGLGVLFHYSNWSGATVRALEFPGPLILRYHNVTPPEWFEGVNRLGAQVTRLGRAVLPAFAKRTTLAIADSEFNRGELVSAGFVRTAVLPILMPDKPRGDAAPDPNPLVLTVGRIVPNKRVDEIIRVFALFQQACNPNATLCIVGSGRWFEPYEQACRRLVDRLKVKGVRFAGEVTEREKHALYRRAAAYLCLSEHEGFGVPLVEAMRWGVPVLGRAKGAVAETLGTGGSVVDTRSRTELAELLDRIVSDVDLRSTLRARQRIELRRFERDEVSKRLRSLLAEVVE